VVQVVQHLLLSAMLNTQVVKVAMEQEVDAVKAQAVAVALPGLLVMVMLVQMDLQILVSASRVMMFMAVIT
jgi:hypothetical protein